ncbi:cytochrome P450 4V2 [Trichonephila clavipes]|nr:cytochrome P450 4V2 [Trichonephila clavipes]
MSVTKSFSFVSLHATVWGVKAPTDLENMLEGQQLSEKYGRRFQGMILETAIGYCRVVFKERINCIYILSKPFILFHKPETVEVVLNSTKMIDKSKEYNLLSAWLGTGLFLSSGTKWRNRRKLLTPAFHFSILDEFIPVFQEQSNVLVSKLQSLVREPWVDVVQLMTACTLDIICQTAMGVNLDIQGGENSEYVRAIHE